MKDRVLKNWTITRAFYVFIGGFLAVQAVQNASWMGILVGVYFASMGIFSFGCAAGACYVPNSTSEKTALTAVESVDVEFSEIKTK